MTEITLNELRVLIAEDSNIPKVLMEYNSLSYEAKNYLKVELRALSTKKVVALVKAELENLTIKPLDFVNQHDWFFDKLDLSHVGKLLKNHMDAADLFPSHRLKPVELAYKGDLRWIIEDYAIQQRPHLKTQDITKTKYHLRLFEIRKNQYLNIVREYSNKTDNWTEFDFPNWNHENLYIKKLYNYLYAIEKIMKLSYGLRTKNCHLKRDLVQFYDLLTDKEKEKFMRALYESWLNSEV
jgi:hypothetical protein